MDTKTIAKANLPIDTLTVSEVVGYGYDSEGYRTVTAVTETGEAEVFDMAEITIDKVKVK
jgi:hypothetical protein